LIALVITLGLGLILVSATAAAKAVAAERQRQSLVAYRLTFPKGLGAEDVMSCLAGFSGLLLPWWRRWGAIPHVVLETLADSKGIRHQILVPEHWAQVLENILQASVPSVRFERAEVETLALTVGAEYRLSARGRALTVDVPALSAKLLFGLQPLGPTEHVEVSWMITPAGPVAPVRVASAKEQERLWQPAGTVPDGEAATALKQKQSQPLMLGVARIGVAASSNRSARRLLRRIEASWHESRSPGVHLKRRFASEAAVARAITRRAAPAFVWPSTYNVQELSGLIGWPVGAMSVPGLVLGGSRLLAASPIIPTIGTILADSNFPGHRRVLALDLEGRLRHVHILGPTGTGKSTLLVWMIVQDILAGHAVILIDPKGDVLQAVLERLPLGRWGDVVVMDAADPGGRMVGLNPLRVSDPDQAEVVVENLVGLFHSLYRSSWGPRTDDILRAALGTLARSGEYTLCEVPLILTDPNFRRRLVGKLDDPVGLGSFWGWFESISDAERLTVTSPLLNKVRAFTMRPRVRAIVGQAQPTISIREVMASGKILLCSLASGILGDEAASLLGALIVAEFWNATTARAGVPASSRRPVMAYADEWQRLVHLPTPMAAVLAESRGFGVGWTLAHQEMGGQLTPELRSAVLANARSKILYQLPADDARLMARQLGGPLTADDLQGLGAYEVAAQLFAGGSTQSAATGRTRPLPQPSSDPEEIRRWSREQYGVDRDEIELAIRKRQMGSTAGPIGRRSKADQDGGGHD
jgi:hypothetical protein